MRCPNCGKEVREGKKFCTDCGAAMGEPTTQIPQAAAPQVQVPSRPSAPPPAVKPGAQTLSANQVRSKT